MADNIVPWSDRSDDDCVDDLLGFIADATGEGAPELEVDADYGSVADDFDPQDIVNEIVSNVFTSREQMGVLGHFILAGEVIHENGEATLMVVTSDNLPDWVARGMIMSADDYISEGLLDPE